MLTLLAGIPAAAAQVKRLGVYSPSALTEAVRHTEADNPASIYLLDENYRFTSGASNAAFGWKRAYIIDGQYLREFNKNDLVAGPLSSYDSGTALLDVQLAGAEDELVVLTRTALQIVRLGTPPNLQVLSSVSVSNSQPAWSRLLAAFGDTIYVADNALRGIRVIDASNVSAPTEVARYLSKAKVVGKPSSFTVTDLRREGSVLSFVVGGNLELVTVDNPLKPATMTTLGVSKFANTSRAVLKGGYAFLADGLTVHIVQATPGTAGFLSEVLRFDTSASITDLFARDGRLYLLCGKAGYEVWDISAYAPR